MEIRREIKKENRGGNLVSKEKKQCKAQKTAEKKKVQKNSKGKKLCRNMFAEHCKCHFACFV